MLTLITGGAASGKSDYAESLAISKGAGKLFYVATMRPEEGEALERIEKHQKKRAGKNFITIECPTDLSGLKIPASFEGSLILLEDLGNLVANEQFDTGGSDKEITGRVFEGIRNLCRQAETVIVVGDEVFSDIDDYGEDTLRYMRLLSACSKLTADAADLVTEIIFGIPVPLKVKEQKETEP